MYSYVKFFLREREREREQQRKLLYLQIDYLRRSARMSSLQQQQQQISNTTISSKSLDRIQRRQLKWYGHLHRKDDSRLPNKIYQRTPHSRRKRGRLQQSWKNHVIFGVWEQLYRSLIYVIGCYAY